MSFDLSHLFMHDSIVYQRIHRLVNGTFPFSCRLIRIIHRNYEFVSIALLPELLVYCLIALDLRFKQRHGLFEPTDS